ncbi:MAG: 2-amino-4-hydroxy-6-hydroxymethyldihydropteridine diphosphokinase [Hahellaceae bacterium]|nr:2-amino-4-hydroxy-6-hydroxymethyldihydropteridine diphosphokinase [Hahellaceae bacterium]
MTEVLVGIGSNIERHHNIQLAAHTLRQQFGAVDFSPVFEAEAVGFKGDPFFNLVARFECSVSLLALQRILKGIEAQSGRTGRESKWSGRTLDIDILTFGDAVGVMDGIVLPRPEILENAYVLLPLATLVPTLLHPQRKQTYQSLWQNFEGSRALTETHDLRDL